MNKNITPYVEKFLQALCFNLNETNNKSGAKTVAIIAIGDLIMECENDCSKYYAMIM